jgi:hypothetical protein
MRVALLLVVITSAAFLATQAQADPYRWCAIYRGSSESCYFVTIEQCQASVSGRGGFCRPNYYSDRQLRQPSKANPMGRRVRP